MILEKSSGPVPPGAAPLRVSTSDETRTTGFVTSIRRHTDRRIIPGQGYLPGLDDITAAKPRPRRTAHAALYGPSTTRARWLLTYGCPACGTWHHAYANSRDTAAGPRKAACGRIITIRVARAYGTDGQPPADRGRAR